MSPVPLTLFAVSFGSVTIPKSSSTPVPARVTACPTVVVLAFSIWHAFVFHVFGKLKFTSESINCFFFWLLRSVLSIPVSLQVKGVRLSKGLTFVLLVLRGSLLDRSSCSKIRQCPAGAGVLMSPCGAGSSCDRCGSRRRCRRQQQVLYLWMSTEHRFPARV